MADFNETAEFVRRHAEKQRDIIALGDKLKEIGSIDLAAKETQAALDKVTTELNTATAGLEKTKADHEAFMATRERDLEAHRTTASGITDAANRAAAETVARAKTVAKDSIDAANAEVARIQAARVAAAASDNADFQGARQRLAGVLQAVEEKQAEHDEISSKIQAMRDLARTAIGV